MKGGNYSESQKMAGQKGWPQARAGNLRTGVMTDDQCRRPEGARDVETTAHHPTAPHFQLASDGHGDPARSHVQLSRSTWSFPTHSSLLDWQGLWL